VTSGVWHDEDLHVTRHPPRVTLKLVPEVGIAPTSPRLQRGANLSQLLGVLAHGVFLCAEMVVPAGNAPASSGYQPGALLLSYGTGKVNREAFEGTPPDVLVDLSIQERHPCHRPALGLRVHDDPMPARQRDGFVIAMTHRAPGIHPRIATHHAPTPSLGGWVV
jgi:hypothetical protein